MKLATLREGLASNRRASAVLGLLLAAALLTNIILAGIVIRMAGHERIVMVPPSIHKTFWVEAERVSPEYLQQMAYFLLQLTLNVTPHNVDHQSKLLLTYAAPAAYGELRTTLAATAERVRRDGAATVFSAQDISVDERTMRVGVRGQLTTYISDRRVSDISKGYALEFHYTAGRIYLNAFRETPANDPLETQNRPAPAAAPAGA
jgi:conjugal transfer pilus assembly protein TraE